METTNNDQPQVDAREEAAVRLRDRHQREAEALGALIASISRRATAVEIVEKETEHIASRLVEMSRLGFDDAELADLGIDLAILQITRPSGTSAQPAEQVPPIAQMSPREDGASPVGAAGEHAGGVRTTAHLPGTR